MALELDLDHTEDLTINTTHRHTRYCRKVSEDGTKTCSLYSTHEGLCKPNHGTEKDRFEGVYPEQRVANSISE